MKLKKMLVEKSLVPNTVSKGIFACVWEYFSKYSDMDIITHGDELGKEILKLVNREMPNVGLKEVSIFQDSTPNNESDVYALPNIGKIVVSKGFMNRGSAFTNKREFSNHMSELLVHELVHIIQQGNGAFRNGKGIGNGILSKDISAWFSRDKNQTAKYDFHTMSTIELQAVGVQIAVAAIHSGKLEHTEKFSDFLNNVMGIHIGYATVKDVLFLRRMDGEKFSTKDPIERKALKTVYRSFLNVIHDEFYGEGHDDEQQAKFKDERSVGEQTRQSKKRNKELRLNLLNCKRALLGDSPFPSFSLFRRIVSFGDNVLESAFMEHINESVIKSSVGDKLDVKDGSIVFDGVRLKSLLDQIDLEVDNRREVYAQFMQELYSQIHSMAGEITNWRDS